MARMSICSSSMEVFGRRKLIRPVIFSHLASVRDRGALVLGAAASAAMAQAQGPEALVNQLSNEVLEAVRADKAIQSRDSTNRSAPLSTDRGTRSSPRSSRSTSAETN